jgi:hypothetical protein
MTASRLLSYREPGSLRESGTKESQSRLIAGLTARRSVDEVLLGCYLSGANGCAGSAFTAFARGATIEERNHTAGGTAPSAVYPVTQPVVGYRGVSFSLPRRHRVAGENRYSKKVILVTVLVGLGVKDDGQKVILDLELFQSESSSCLEGFVERLVSRGLEPPCVVIIDGNKGLRAAVEKKWPGTAVQRCTVHKAAATWSSTRAARFRGS